MRCRARRFTAATESPCRRRPTVEAIPVTDNYFGTKIVDNYRWLEDANSPETQGVHRRRECLHRALHEAGAHPSADCRRSGCLEHVIRAGRCRSQRGNDLFFKKLLAGEEQSSIYVRHGWTEKDKRLIDPAQFSRDPNTSVDLDGCFPRRNAGGLRGARGRRGRNHGARLQREDRQDAGR